MDVGRDRRARCSVIVGWRETPVLIAIALAVSACDYRVGGRTSWNASHGTVAYLAEARGGVVGQLEGDPAPDDPKGWMIAPEFGLAVGVEGGDFRVRSSVAVPSYKYVQGAWGAQMMVDFVGDFGADGEHGWGPELRVGLLREVSRRDYEMKLVSLDLTAAHLFGDKDGWVLGVGGSFGHLDQKPRQYK